MLLFTLSIAFAVSLFFFRLMRRLLWVLAILAAAGLVVSRIPLHSASWQCLTLVIGLIGHLIAHSFATGFHQYERWGRELLHHHAA